MGPATLICPLCNDKVDRLVYAYHLGGERQILERIRLTHPGWAENDGICHRCVDYYHTEIVIQQRILPEIGPHFPVKSADDFIILPTGLRLNADQRFTGKNITICFIDSGFYPHPDLVSSRNRIKTAVDITRPYQYDILNPPGNSGSDAWHGTMTSVVCAGDGYLSNGLYKGIACDADLVLLKVQDQQGAITTDNIVKALQWVLDNYKQYHIRIVNISLGSEETGSFRESKIDKLAEELIAKGILVVAAVGNDEQGMIRSPANSPNVITVGGMDDENKLASSNRLYHSSFGRTPDDIQKPELIAPAIWVAAPILPGTEEYTESGMLHELLKSSETEDTASNRSNIISRLQTRKYISKYYMHVDGTSFAAPIVSAVLAQLLEANPELTPSAAREILFSTAKRIEGFPAERQGFGAIQPKKALLKALRNQHISPPEQSPLVNTGNKVVEFYVHNDWATEISLAGSFNNWAEDELQLEPGRHGAWKISIPILKPGRYYYKFHVDQSYWLEDVNNPMREPDGFNGFNSVLLINPQ
jgi:serine protease AprX